MSATDPDSKQDETAAEDAMVEHPVPGESGHLQGLVRQSADRVVVETQLVRCIARGDCDALDQLYGRFSTPLYSFAIHLLDNAREANEVLQTVFQKIWETAGSYDESKGKPLSWAVTLTREMAVDRLRVRSGEVFATGYSAPFRAVEFLSAVESLPENQRLPIELVFMGGLNVAQVAEILRQPPGTISGRIQRGMVSLRGELEGQL